MLFSADLLKQTGDFRRAMPSYPASDGTRFAPVFTDKDLARRFVEENPAASAIELMPVEDLARLCCLLRLYQTIGVSHVGTDFSSRRFKEPGWQGQLRAIEAFLRELAAG
jgi:hypothetical protein